MSMLFVAVSALICATVSTSASSVFVDLELPANKTAMDYEEYLNGQTWRYFVSNWDAKPQLRTTSRQLTRGKAMDLLEDAAREDDKRRSQGSRWHPPGRPEPVVRTDVGDRTAAFGSNDQILSTGDRSLLGAVLEAYNHHWNLRVSPEDFWFPVIRRVAKAIDENSRDPKVREFFVTFEGKKNINILVNSPTLNGVDFSWLFQAFSQGVRDNVLVPSYVDIIHANFSTSTDVFGIVSDITLMASLQEYFTFEATLICGIKAVEMMGTVDDWNLLVNKLQRLKEILAPLDESLGNLQPWFADVEEIFGKLVETYKENPDVTWWRKIVTDREEYGSGGGSFFDGWIIRLVEGARTTKQSKVSGGLVTVPLKITHNGGSENSTLVAGMLGFTVGNDSPNGIPFVQPFQGWALLLDPDSGLRPLPESDNN